MNRMKTAKEEMEILMEISSSFRRRFNNKKLTPQLRKELYEYIKFLTTKFNIIREDKDSTVQLWVTQSYKDHGMSSDILIYIVNGVINVNDDSLWRTIEGLNEVVNGE